VMRVVVGVMVGVMVGARGERSGKSESDVGSEKEEKRGRLCCCTK